MDFLGQGVGGMQQAQGPNMVGGAGVGTPQPIGPTYGDLAKGAMQYGSQPGSSAPAMANAMPGSGWQQRSMQPLAPTAPPQAKQAIGQPDRSGSDDSLAQIAKFFSMLFSNGAGAPTGTGAP
jgi:hypothetical protein